MHIEILGSAAGGGFPQWNCDCRNCHSLRSGTFSGKPRSQAQVAVSEDQKNWFLLNACPDLRTQIERTAALHPRHGIRDSPISGVVLTSADIDQVAGLLSLRELQPFSVYCTPSLRRILREDNSVFGMLNRVADQVSWKDVTAGSRFPLTDVQGETTGVCCETFSSGTRYPQYVSQKRTGLKAEEATLGLVLESSSGKKLAYLPAVPTIESALVQRLESVDLILFDGTFWTDDELIRAQGGGQTARQMGHVPVSGEDGTLRVLAGLRRPRKIFTHINNTNPMLDESGPEYRLARESGWELAEDGIRLSL